jgi:hypothetical protein
VRGDFLRHGGVAFRSRGHINPGIARRIDRFVRFFFPPPVRAD